MQLGGTVAVLAIDGYRRFVSPYKGFSCAHHKVHGDGSCSDYGRSVFRRHGVRAGLKLMRIRFDECKSAAQTMQAMASRPEFGKRQREQEDDEDRTKSQQSRYDRFRRWRQRTYDNCNCDPGGCNPPSCGSPRGGSSGTGDCNLSGLDCSPPSSAIDVCSVGDACACSW